MVWTQYFVPPNSPDLSPMDYFVWSVVGSKANEHRVASRDSPKGQITVGDFEHSHGAYKQTCDARELPDLFLLVISGCDMWALVFIVFTELTSLEPFSGDAVSDATGHYKDVFPLVLICRTDIPTYWKIHFSDYSMPQYGFK